MGTASLVGTDVETGARIVKLLDEAGLKVDVALWAVLSEYGDNRLILASRRFDDASPLKANGKILNAIRGNGIPTYRVPPFLVLRMKDPFIEGLRNVFGETMDVEGMRLGGQSFGDRFIEDGYVYRIS